MMWLALERFARDGQGMEQVLPHLEALAQFASELDGRLAVDGVSGVDGVLGLYRRLQGVLDAIPDAEVERVAAGVRELQAVLDGVARDLDRLTRLKSLLR